MLHLITATKKPIEIEAVIFTGTVRNATDILHWMTPSLPKDSVTDEVTIKTLEGEMKASVGDYIIRGVKGEFYPCKPDIFLASYDIVHQVECGNCHGTSPEDEEKIQKAMKQGIDKDLQF